MCFYDVTSVSRPSGQVLGISFFVLQFVYCGQERLVLHIYMQIAILHQGSEILSSNLEGSYRRVLTPTEFEPKQGWKDSKDCKIFRRCGIPTLIQYYSSIFGTGQASLPTRVLRGPNRRGDRCVLHNACQVSVRSIDMPATPSKMNC